MRLPEPCRRALAELHAAKEQAAKDYAIASNAVLLALGFDLKDPISLNLDTGEIAVQQKEEPQ